MKKVLSVQNIACESLGTLEDLLEADGFSIETVNAQTDRIPDAAGYSAVIILGGPMAVYDNFQYLHREQELVRDAVKNDIPVLGICLGSQLIAQAMGGRVYKGAKKELGWHQVSLTGDGERGLFAGGGNKMRVFQWHGDTYDLPPNATVLAYSDLYPQAFRIKSAIGVQFHLEVDERLIRAWMKEYGSEVRAEKVDERDLLPAAGDLEKLAKGCQLAYRNFARMVR
ncbi:MAG: type 1 glutamine amidotransferase [Nitrososphaera sp.]|uniref:type 1 glutamine amidotransferase n=1 Tax=Nitrososphaera sp. TaxID=1971748 RepID=UPI003D6E391C